MERAQKGQWPTSGPSWCLVLTSREALVIRLNSYIDFSDIVFRSLRGARLACDDQIVLDNKRIRR